jgi:hypothetical protein
VKQLESGITNIDYLDFRNSFLESKQYSNKSILNNELKKMLFENIKIQNFQEVVRISKEMLSVDYTSFFAHLFLAQGYNMLGDSINQKKYSSISAGLLKSILQSGDGKTCETGWHVTQVDEEYFLLNLLGVEVKKQSLIRGTKNSCDQMEGKGRDGLDHSYFFEINKVLEMETKMFSK